MENITNIDGVEIDTWLAKNIIPKVAESLHKPSDNVTWTITQPKGYFYMSRIIFVQINFNTNSYEDTKKHENDCVHAVIKTPGIKLQENESFHGDALFHNEILFYRLVSRNSLEFPRCIYFFEDQNELKNSIIITENIAEKGYEICPEIYNIPFEYVISGMQTIGRFHAMGYTMKTRKPLEFSQIIADIQENRYIPGDTFDEFINIVALRPIEWLRKQNYDSNFVDKMYNFLSDAYNNIMLDAVKPVEPLAVLCHGDFTRANIYFKKTDTYLTGMLIDFAMLRYSPPSTDISLFLYISGSMKDRVGRFSEIFKAYHDALVNYLRDEGIEDSHKYSYDKMLADYKRRAMYGYITAVFFIPVLRDYINFDDYKVFEFDVEKRGQLVKEAGGDALSKELADYLLELRDSGCLDHVMCGKK